ncbi:MAG: site-specific integrase [Myxococcaceae bacterium]|nr:site-specific integrase [Myxococcaceae bacterium]
MNQEIDMASVYRKQNRWWIHYKDGTGRWRDISTKADTKTAAKTMAKELEHKAERQQRGLDPIHDPRSRVTLGEVMDIWWKNYGSKLRSTTINLFAEKHIRKTLGSLALVEVTKDKIETFLSEKAETLAPRSVNHLRAHLRRLFNIAINKGLWLSVNPAKQVAKAKVPKKLNDYLRDEEVPRVLAALPAKQRPLFATAIHTGGRKGELLDLRKSDIDLKERTISICRSNENDTTKGGHADLLPIADELVPYLQEAIDTSPSELVFPDAKGNRQRHDVKLQKVLRKAMVKAGIVTGFLHICRKKKCGFKERRSNGAESQCPRCSKTLFVKGIPRPVRFHDLRHTTATLLLKAEVPLATVQRVLRHTDPSITSEIYGHLDLDDMRKAVNKLSFKPTGTSPLKLVR